MFHETVAQENPSQGTLSAMKPQARLEKGREIILLKQQEHQLGI